MSSDPPAPKASHTTRHEGHRSANSGRRRHRTLDGVIATVSQTDGVGLTDVDALTTLPREHACKRYLRRARVAAQVEMARE